MPYSYIINEESLVTVLKDYNKVGWMGTTEITDKYNEFFRDRKYPAVSRYAVYKKLVKLERLGKIRSYTYGKNKRFCIWSLKTDD
jgi:hypothetical protein